jgi:hypothetical protein
MTNGDKIRAMTDEELVDVLRCNCCAFHNMPECASIDCKEGHMIWLKQEVSGDAAERTY